jgi:hypothetical protein
VFTNYTKTPEVKVFDTKIFVSNPLQICIDGKMTYQTPIQIGNDLDNAVKIAKFLSFYSTNSTDFNDLSPRGIMTNTNIGIYVFWGQGSAHPTIWGQNEVNRVPVLISERKGIRIGEYSGNVPWNLPPFERLRLVLSEKEDMPLYYSPSVQRSIDYMHECSEGLISILSPEDIIKFYSYIPYHLNETAYDKISSVSINPPLL